MANDEFSMECTAFCGGSCVLYANYVRRIRTSSAVFNVSILLTLTLIVCRPEFLHNNTSNTPKADSIALKFRSLGVSAPKAGE